MEKVNTHSLLDNPSLIGSFQYKANTCLWNKASSNWHAFVKNMISSSRADISLSKIHQKVRLWIPCYDFYSLDTLLWLLPQIFKRSRACNSEMNDPILLKIKLDPRFYACPGYLRDWSWSEKNWSRYSDDKVFLMLSLWEIYVAMATRVPIWSAQKPYAVFPPAQWCYTWNLIKIVQVALEIYIFEIPIDPNAKIDKGR